MTRERLGVLADIAQLAERILGKDEVPGSNPGIGSPFIHEVDNNGGSPMRARLRSGRWVVNEVGWIEKL